MVGPISFVWATLTPHALFRGCRCNRYVKLESDFPLFDPYLRIDTWRMPFSARRSVFVRYSDRLRRQRESQTLLTVYPQYVSVSLGEGSQPIHLGLLHPLVARRCLFFLQRSLRQADSFQEQRGSTVRTSFGAESTPLIGTCMA